MPGGGPRQRPSPLHESVRGDDADVESAVVRPRTVEDLDAGEELPDVPDQDAARLAAIPRLAVDRDPRFERLGAGAACARENVGSASETAFERPVGVMDLAASKPAPAITPKRSPFKRPTSSLRRFP
jgi:hypothetical protein